MFYLYFFIPLVIILGTYFILKFTVCKNSEKFNKGIDKTLKILVVIYCCLIFLNVLLPDSFVLNISQENLTGKDWPFALLRWAASLSFIILPVSVFFKNRTLRNIAIYFCLPITIVSLCFYSTYLNGFTSVDGKGLNSISVISDSFKAFLNNGTFRSFYIAILWLLEIIIVVGMATQTKHYFNVKSKREWGNFFAILPCVLVCALPIYVPQYLIGYTNLIFTQFSLVQLVWILFIVAEIIALYFIFRKRSAEDKYLLCLIMALGLIMQYFQMFGAVSISVKRLPLQLCNIGAFLILFALISKNKKIFDFTIIVNVVGVIIALAIPALDGKGLGYLWNVHFILEHTNVLIIPVLALALGVFGRLNLATIKNFLIGFAIYFGSVLILGTLFNGIAQLTSDGFWNANYLFMFIEKDNSKIVGFAEALFKLKIPMGPFALYPVVQLLVYIAFNAICLGCYGVIMLIYKIKDSCQNKKQLVVAVPDNQPVSIEEAGTKADKKTKG